MGKQSQLVREILTSLPDKEGCRKLLEDRCEPLRARIIIRTYPDLSYLGVEWGEIERHRRYDEEGRIPTVQEYFSLIIAHLEGKLTPKLQEIVDSLGKREKTSTQMRILGDNLIVQYGDEQRIFDNKVRSPLKNCPELAEYLATRNVERLPKYVQDCEVAFGGRGFQHLIFAPDLVSHPIGTGFMGITMEDQVGEYHTRGVKEWMNT